MDMRYSSTQKHPQEKVITRIELDEAVIAKEVQSIRTFAALLLAFPPAFRSQLVYDFAYHCVAHVLDQSVRTFFPSYLYMEHAASWMHQALTQAPLPEPEYRLDEDQFLTSIVYQDQQTTPERELQEMHTFYMLLSFLDDHHRWLALHQYIKNKYVHTSAFHGTSDLFDTAEILARFHTWLSSQQHEG